MADSNDKIQLSVTLENGQLKVSAADVQKALSGIGASTTAAGSAGEAGIGRLSKSFGSLSTIVKGFIGLQVVQFFLGIGKAAIKGAAELEKNKMAFETLLGSAKKATDLMSSIQETAAKTPLETSDLVEGAKRLIAFGEAEETVIGTMKKLGDAAMGDAATFDRLTLAYGKTQAKQKATMEELNMFTEAGVPILQALADKYKVSTGAMMKMIEQGKVGFKDVNDALTDLTTGNGKFAGMMDKQSRTLGGMYSTFKDSLSMLLTEFGGMFDGVMKALLNGATFLIDKITSGLKSIRERQEKFEESTFNLRKSRAMGGQKDASGAMVYESKANEATGYKGGEKYKYYKKDGKEFVEYVDQSGYKQEMSRDIDRGGGKKQPVAPSSFAAPGPKQKTAAELEVDKLNKNLGEFQKYYSTITNFSNQMLSSVTSNMQMMMQREAQALEEKKQMWDAAVDYWLATQMRQQGLEEETASKKSAKDLQQLNEQYSRTGNVIKRAHIKDEIEAKRHEYQKNKLKEEAEEKKRKLELIHDILNHQMVVKQFRRNQQMQYAQTSINMVTGMIGAVAQGVAMLGPIAGAIVGAVEAAAIGAMGGWALSEISRQQPPMMASGGYVMGSQSGTPIIAGDRGGTEAIVPLDNDEQMEKFRDKTGAGVKIENHFHGAVLDGPKAARWLRDTYAANGWKPR